MFSTIVRVFGSLFGSDSRTGTREGGASAIADALSRRTGGQTEEVGILGEPELRNFATAADLDDEYRVVVPIEVERYENPSPLVFDLPDGFDDYAADFYQFADSLGVTDDAFDEIEGTEVPLGVVNNALVPATHLLNENVDTFYNENGVPEDKSPIQARDDGEEGVDLSAETPTDPHGRDEVEAYVDSTSDENAASEGDSDDESDDESEGQTVEEAVEDSGFEASNSTQSESDTDSQLKAE